MTAVQIHLWLNHSPVFGVLLGLVILVVGLLLKNATVNKVAFYILIGAAVLVVPVYLSGDDAEESLKQYAIGRDQVREHDKAAKFALATVLLTGVLSAVALRQTIKEKPAAKSFSIAVVVFGLFAASTIVRTAHLGGQIRHPEINGATDVVKVNTF